MEQHNAVLFGISAHLFASCWQHEGMRLLRPFKGRTVVNGSHVFCGIRHNAEVNVFLIRPERSSFTTLVNAGMQEPTRKSGTGKEDVFT